MSFFRDREEDRLHTVIGELRLNLTAMQVQLTDIVSRVVKLETVSINEMVALQKFSQHVENCEKQNDLRVVTQRSFRRELRGYAFGILGLVLTGIGFLLYHGLPYALGRP